jgi:hypothetical protein
MKKLALLFILISSTAVAQYQNVIDADYPWYSDIIKYKLPDANSTGGISSLIEVVPKTDNIDFTERLVFLDENLIRLEFENALNEMRIQYNKSTLKYNDTISQNLKYSLENEIASDYNSTYVLFESAEFQNIVMHFENKERAYCDYFIDLATLTDNNFFKMTDSMATEYGFYFDDMYGDGYYTFIVVVK